MDLFECKVSYEKRMENGMQKRVTEPYLVDAVSFTEAEARIIEEMTPFINGEFSVSAVKKLKVSETFVNEEGDKWYKARLMFITLDEKSGAEKRAASTVMVLATDFPDAVATLLDGMKGTLADFEVAEMKETPIMDLFVYTPDGIAS